MSSRADRRRRLTGGLLLGCAALAAAISAAASASAPALEPRALLQAKAIQVQVNARYRRLAGRKLRVTEATSFGAIKSISIIEDVFEPARVVPADNGIYFQIRSLQTRRPHRERSAAWTDDAFRPRRLAVELAARTFARTTASLAVVSLPTRFTWVVFERAAFLAELGTPLPAQITADPGYADADLRTLVERLTRRQTVAVIEIVADTVSAIAIYRP